VKVRAQDAWANNSQGAGGIDPGDDAVGLGLGATEGGGLLYRSCQVRGCHGARSRGRWAGMHLCLAYSGRLA
jgi:hypothetical protein